MLEIRKEHNMKYTRDSLINKFNCGKINQSVTLIINLTSSQSILKAGIQNTSRLGTHLDRTKHGSSILGGHKYVQPGSGSNVLPTMYSRHQHTTQHQLTTCQSVTSYHQPTTKLVIKGTLVSKCVKSQGLPRKTLGRPLFAINFACSKQEQRHLQSGSLVPAS